MNSPRLPHGRDARTVVIGAIAIAAIVLLGRGLPAAIAWRHDMEREAADARTEWESVEAAARSQPMVRDSARARRTALGDALPTLVHGGSVASASAGLAGVVSEAASSAGTRIGAIDVRAETTSASFYLHVIASTEVTGDVRGVAQFLALLEGGPTRIRIRELSIAQPAPFAGDADPEALRAAVTVESLARRGVVEQGRASGSRR